MVAFVDFAIGLAILALMMVWYQFAPGPEVLLLPLFVVLGFLAALGPSLWITSLNVRYRDFRYLTPFLVQFGLYVSPVGFSSGIVPDEWRLLYSVNPMVGVIDGFRWALLGGETPLYWPGLVMSLALSAGLLWLGVRKFRRVERSFADLM
jgi:lipopolysaccharide transport system permease protein